MVKKKRNNGKMGAGIGVWHQNLRPETKHSLWAVLSFLVAVILALAYFGKAGLIGNAIQKTLLLVFGKGFFLVSLAFFLAGLSFLFALGNHLLITTVLGGILFLISSLGLADILFGKYTGGYVGFLFSYPFLKLFDFLASLLIMLNVSLKPKRKEKKDSESEEKVFATPTVSLPSLLPAKIEEKKIEEENIFSAPKGRDLAFGEKNLINRNAWNLPSNLNTPLRQWIFWRTIKARHHRVISKPTPTLLKELSKILALMLRCPR